MKTFKSVAGNSWLEELEFDSSLRKFMPMTQFNLINNGELVIEAYLNGDYIGNCQAYSTLNVTNRMYNTFLVKTVDGQSYKDDELIIYVSKSEIISAMPHNPQLDLMEDNFDRFASGCDARISTNTLIGSDQTKYWINIQNNLITQRRLEVEGSASMGQYAITFGSTDNLSGSVGINMVSTNEKRMKKTIVNREFDYSTTNCTISGWIIDYLKRTGDISSDYTVVTGGATAPNAYDDDMGTFFYYAGINGVYTTKWEVSFASMDLTEINLFCKLYGVWWVYLDLQVYSEGSWVSVEIITDYDDSQYQTIYQTTGWTNCTGLRVRGRGSNTYQTSIYDISVY